MHQRIRLDAIKFDAGTQIRAAINDAIVSDYAERMSEGIIFPAVVLFHDGNHYYMADGFHRGLASLRIGFKDIEADVRPGTTTDALWFALGANKANAHRMTDADKRHALELAFRTWPSRSANEISEQAGCTQVYASKIREQVKTSFNLPDRVTGKDGKSYPASRTKTNDPSTYHVIGGQQAMKQREDQRHQKIAEMVVAGKSNKEIIASIGADRNDLIADVRRELGLGATDKSRAAVAQRRKDISDMAQRGYSSRQIAETLHIHESTVAEIAKKDGIVIHADRIVGRTRRVDSNRVVEQMVQDAENLTADVGLIDFEALDKAQIAEWLRSLASSRDKLGAFIRRLMKEQKNGEAA